MKSEAGPGLHKYLTRDLDLGPGENCKILPESIPSLWIHGHLYHLIFTAITLYTVAIGNPGRHMRKASQCGSKRQ